MGQKTNPNILQIGKTKSWNSKYIENKTSELPTYIFRDLEIKNFLYKFFEIHGLLINNCKIQYSTETINIFISYSISQKALQLIKSNNSNKLTFSPKNFKYFKNYNFKKQVLLLKKSTLFFNKYLNHSQSLKKHNSLPKRLNILNKTPVKKTRIPFLNYFNTFYSTHNLETKSITTLKNSAFSQKMLQILNLFLNNNMNINLNLKQLDKTNFKNFDKNQILSLKKNIAKFRWFQQQKFFHECLQTITLFLKSNGSAKFLGGYLADELKKHRRQLFFLNFVKKAFTVLNKNNFCKPVIVKIKIKGRLNGALRSKNKVINIGGLIPEISIRSNIDYSEHTIFTSKGTLGLKLWVYKPSN